MKLLIVDDQPRTYETFIEDLRKERPDMQVTITDSAAEALELVKSREYRLVVLDYDLGHGAPTGTDFLQMLNEATVERPEIIYVTQHFNELSMVQILNTGVPVALFLEKHDRSFAQTLLVAVRLVLRRIESQVRYDPNDLFGEPFIDLVIKESTDVIKQQHAGYYTPDQQLQIGTLVRSYVSSLKMRSQWDVDDVLELSIFFAQSLCSIFGLVPDDIMAPSLVEVLRRFLNLEDVLYTIPQYRDHFFHQVKVFLLGFCIINVLNRNGRLQGTMLEQASGMKLWFMASMFHDIGYPFEKMSRWLTSYIEGTLRSPGDKELDKTLIPISFHWGALLGKRFHAYHLEQIAQHVCQTYGKGAQVQAELLSRFSSLVVDQPDHGLYSSLIVQNFLRFVVADAEVDPVAAAIALHNDEVAEQVYVGMMGPQTFERDPLSFLLAFCDLAQDWGRMRPAGLSRMGYGKFGYPIYDSPELYDATSDTVRVILRYTRPFSLAEGEEWMVNIYQKHIEKRRNLWMVSANGQRRPHFCIEYQATGGANPTLAELHF